MRATALSVLSLATAILAQHQLAVRDAEPVFGIDAAAIAAGGLSAGDLDGDGDVDLVAPGGRVLRNGGGFFDTVDPVVPVVSGPTALIDVDGDGDLDVFQAGWDAAATRPAWIMINDGTGGLRDESATRIVGLPVRADDVEIVDIDGDGDPDVLLAGAAGLGLLENRGGTLHDVSAGRFPTQPAIRVAIAATDSDGDGDADIAAWSGELLANDGHGTFALVPNPGTSAPSFDWLITDDVLAGDLDADGDEDLVLGDLVHVNSGGRYTPSRPLPLVAVSQRVIALVDLDADADLDLVVGGFGHFPGRTSSAAVLRNDGGGGFAAAPPVQLPTDWMSSTAALPVDVDNDRDLDIVLFPNERTRARLIRNHGTGQFALAARARFAIDSWVFRGAIADLDGDGDLDVARAYHRFHWNDGAGTFEAIAPVSGPSPGDSIHVAGDIDGDGDLDLIGWTRDRGARLLRNLGNRVFVDGTAGRLSDSGGLAVAQVLADFDGDGDLDLLIGDSAVGTILPPTRDRLHRNDGTGTFTFDPNGVGGPTVDSNAFLPFDFDGDGDLDVVRAGSPSALLRNDGAGHLTPVPGLPPSNANTVSAGDIDSDGDLDLLLGAAILVNDGTGRFTDETAQRLPNFPPPQTPTLADLDDDGSVDVATAVGFWRNDGTGVFSDVSTTRIELPISASWQFQPSPVDVDADGDLDLIVTVSNFGVYLGANVVVNHHRQLTSPGEPVLGGALTLVVQSEPGYGTSAALAVPLIAARPARVPIPGIGVLGLDPGTLIALSPRLVPLPKGEARVVIPVPNVANLRGAHVFAQCLLSTTSGLALTHAVRDEIR